MTSLQRVDLGFRPRPRCTRAAMGVLFVGVVCASVVVGHYQVTLGRLGRAQADTLASHRERPGIDPRRIGFRPLYSSKEIQTPLSLSLRSSDSRSLCATS